MDPTEIAKKKLDDKYEELAAKLKEQRDLNSALDELQRTRDSLVQTLSVLSKLAPLNLLDVYASVNGRVWLSKRVFLQGTGSMELRITGNYVNYQDPLPDYPTGLYRIMLIILPENAPEIKKGEAVPLDDYGRPIYLKG